MATRTRARWTCILLTSLGLLVVACAEEASDDPDTSPSKAGSGSVPSSGGTESVPRGGSTSAGSGGAPLGSGGTSVGTGGNAGVPSVGDCAPDALTILSDFEIGGAKVNAIEGRSGSWFLYNDKTTGGVQTPAKEVNKPLATEAPGACASAFAFHFTSKGFIGWGAGAGTDLAPKAASGGPSTAYDASTYTGLKLHAKSSTPVVVSVSVSDANTDKEGLICADTTDRTNKMRCGDYFGSTLTLSGEWQYFEIPFAAMKQDGWGLPIASGVDKSQLYSLRVQAKGDYDIWIDNVGFTK